MAIFRPRSGCLHLLKVRSDRAWTSTRKGALPVGVPDRSGLCRSVEGLVEPKFGSDGLQCHALRVWQVNQGYGMVVSVPPGVAAPLPTSRRRVDHPSLLSLAGVPGREPPVYVSLENPCGHRPLLPTGNVTDKLTLLDGSFVEACDGCCSRSVGTVVLNVLPLRRCGGGCREHFLGRTYGRILYFIYIWCLRVGLSS